MSFHNLQFLFRPESLAVIGASERPGSVGATVFRNLLEGGFPGPVWPVNPKRRTVAGRFAYPDVETLPAVPHAAVVCTPRTRFRGSSQRSVRAAPGRLSC